MKKEKKRILLTNDDGYLAEGIQCLFRLLSPIYDVSIVAPDREKSAASLALTLHHPLRMKKIQPKIYAVEGTPADCVYMAVEKVLCGKPDLLISGFNHGPNVGQQDISYSGTVAGAKQGSFLDIPSLAVSLVPDANKIFHFEPAAEVVRKIAVRMLKTAGLNRTTFNINFPPPPFKGIRMAPLGWKSYHPQVIEKKDPRNRSYYWIGMGSTRAEGTSESDVKVIHQGYITVTPLHHDTTFHQALKGREYDNILKAVEHEISQKII
ncbi:MAG: 5'/3'-nucleotidase SurE [Candidatus Aminicenantes bacterium]|nr:5'/3'-nucleotidase SurE [Candidatus Aminicenantes bacterium]